MQGDEEEEELVEGDDEGEEEEEEEEEDEEAGEVISSVKRLPAAPCCHSMLLSCMLTASFAITLHGWHKRQAHVIHVL